jgi:NhaC family Na+:H+ antiporter
MLWTTVPSMAIALAIYAVLGAGKGGEASADGVQALIGTLHDHYHLTPVLLLAPLSVIVLVALRVPALPAILVGAGVGAVLALTVQGTSGADLYNAMQSEYESQLGVTEVDELLSQGGLESMFWTIGIILCAMAFGGLMECTGMLGAIADAIMKVARGTGSLVASTLATCIGMNIAAPDQYLSIVVPGRMYKEAYRKAGLAPKNLSRALEDAGTLSSPLVPWNTCGAFMMGALGVNPLVYLPFAFFNLLCPLVSALFGFTGWTMAKEKI